ncbi:response regulator [Geofilum rubicundum]|uniref:Hydrogenase transcriptional regulatory protein HoxA n=1 Tax=Geofilum rubicundum JCM 15548 TaxID=1236989 RepID=A0A0E9LZU0_9BACT|nr:response regulator [Geofilum rubicundum]GAO30646.1 hydrogenase transcriptional regulatory protein HoxA [Geofilum rubicundum JCM 15548]
MANNISVLYVDDEPINLKVFELGLRNRFTIHTALSGFEGLEILRKESGITVVVSDMRMPVMDGLEFIEAAKKEFPNLVFFIYTGYGICDRIAQALDDNLLHKYFRKPTSFNDIEATIVESVGV